MFLLEVSMDESALKISNVMSVKFGTDDMRIECYIIFIIKKMNNIIISINCASLLDADSVINTVISNLPDGPLSKSHIIIRINDMKTIL